MKVAVIVTIIIRWTDMKTLFVEHYQLPWRCKPMTFKHVRDRRLLQNVHSDAISHFEFLTVLMALQIVAQIKYPILILAVLLFLLEFWPFVWQLEMTWSTTICARLSLPPIALSPHNLPLFSLHKHCHATITTATILICAIISLLRYSHH